MLLPLPPGEFDAYLFDCDGTITDSMPVHYLAWQAALAEWGAELGEDLFYAWAGRPVADIIADLNTGLGLAMPVAEVAERRERIFQGLLPRVTAVPGVLEHIRDAYGRVPFAVVSGSTRDSVTASLAALDLLDRFDVLVCAGDYADPKPAPDCFLLAAAELGVAPERCVVFEDSDLGIRAASAAGMAWVRVPSPVGVPSSVSVPSPVGVRSSVSVPPPVGVRSSVGVPSSVRVPSPMSGRKAAGTH